MTHKWTHAVERDADGFPVSMTSASVMTRDELKKWLAERLDAIGKDSIIPEFLRRRSSK